MAEITVVQPKALPSAWETDLFRKKERLQWYRPDPERPLRLSRVTINFPMMVRKEHESELEGRQAALDAWYDYCDLAHIAELHGQVVQYVRTITASGPDARKNTSGDEIIDTGTQTHAFSITWRKLFEGVFSGLEMQSLQGYLVTPKGSDAQNLKLALCHPQYMTHGTPVAVQTLLDSIRSARQPDGSVTDLFNSPIIATLWVNPTRKHSDQPRDGSSRSYGGDEFVGNLVIRPIVKGHTPLILSRAALYVSHEVVDGVKEVFIREFDSRRRG